MSCNFYKKSKTLKLHTFGLDMAFIEGKQQFKYIVCTNAFSSNYILDDKDKLQILKLHNFT